MNFFIGVLTFFLVVNCAVLILLVLVQLPKKDAGAGLAFGGGVSRLLFGTAAGGGATGADCWICCTCFSKAAVFP